MQIFRLVATILILALQTGASAAHDRSSTPRNTSGIPIPGISHGEMAILAPYREAILNLAESSGSIDPAFRTLVNYNALEYSQCLWGLAPRAVVDEDSPFNECAHAYLAAAKTLLLRMRDMPEMHDQAERLVSEIDVRMVQAGAAFIGCQYSGESFNTAEFVTPHWEKLTSHPPTLYAIGGFAALLAAPVLFKIWLLRRRPQQATS